MPTNNELDKKNDGKTLWFSFVSKSIELLKNNSGMLCMFIPSIWLKPDREKIYYFLTEFNIKNLNCFSNSDTNKIFKGNAQTPSCYFLLTKTKSDKIINLAPLTSLKRFDEFNILPKNFPTFFSKYF